MEAPEADSCSELQEVPQLRRLWLRTARSGGQGTVATEWAADQAVIYGLGLGLHETLGFLYTNAPSFASFERWIVDRIGGPIGTTRIAEVNSAVARARGETAMPVCPLVPNLEPALGESELRCWEENGFVVLRGAVPPESCRDAELAIWDFLTMDPGDPESWYHSTKCEGIMVPLVHHPAFEKNRRAPRIRNAFAQLWGTADLQVTIDRGGFNPPERPDWHFPTPGLHWDTSLMLPLSPYLQGILYLTDTPAEQGAFRCVPGFHLRLETWLASLPQGADPRTQDLSHEAVPIAGKAGDMVIWHGALPHGASANHGKRPRLVQYIAYRPPETADDRPWR